MRLIVFVISETTRTRKGKELFQAPLLKSAPHYFEKTVPQQYIINQDTFSLQNKEGSIILKTYQPDILLAEASFEIADIFSDEVLTFKEEVITYCREYLKKKGGKDVDESSEEYSVFVISQYPGDPEQFLTNKARLVGLLKSEKLPLDPLEIDYTLTSQIKYAKNDMVIVDWDGALIFDPEGDFESTLELLELANLQLLRYRILDKELDLRSERVVKLLEGAPIRTRSLFRAAEVSQAMKDIMLVRSRSISDFQALEREIKLIGDWYSARLYELTAKKFKLDDWRKTIRDKLDAMEDVYTIASENFTISWERRGRIIELFGWYVLLIGWLVLLILDFYFYKVK